MTKPSDHAIQFEAVKVAMNQTRDGYKLVLAIHPNEVPEELLRSLVGSRYVIAAVEVDDHEQIKPLIERQPLTEGEEAVRYAGQLCREKSFQDWMVSMGYSGVASEERAAMGLRTLLRIDSRAELRDNEQKRKLLHEIAGAYLGGR